MLKNFVRTWLVRVKVPSSTPKFFPRVGDVTDSIEVLQTSCKGLSPFRSTNFLSVRVAQTEEAKVSKTFMCKFKSCREYFNFPMSACSPTAEAIGLNPIYVRVQISLRALLWGRMQRAEPSDFQSDSSGFKSRRPYQVFQASIAKRTKAAVCKTVNHRFKSDCSLQHFLCGNVMKR